MDCGLGVTNMGCVVACVSTSRYAPRVYGKVVTLELRFL